MTKIEQLRMDIAAADGVHIALSPEDVSFLSPAQASFTKHFEEKIGSRQNVINNALRIIQEAMTGIQMAMPLYALQRAAYEADLIAKKPDATIREKAGAQGLWIMLNAIQQTHVISLGAMKDELAVMEKEAANEA